MMIMNKNIFSTVLLLCTTLLTIAEEREEMLPFGDMNSWMTRAVEESFIIGGDTKYLYEIAPERQIASQDGYKNMGGSPWANSNVLAKVSGVTKTSSSVFPDQGTEGKSARLETRIEKVKVFGVINISVLAAGAVFLGEMCEPIRSTSNPQGILNSGIPFTKRPKAVRFDYKVQLSGEPNRVKITGFGPKREVEGVDMPTMVLLLQKRWEDADGTLHARRVGTAVVNYTESCDWQKDATYEVIYGDPKSSLSYIPEMKVGHEQRYAMNSKGENVELLEEGYTLPDETPTHAILHFASSHGGAYIGSPGTQMWVDNVRFVY